MKLKWITAPFISLILLFSLACFPLGDLFIQNNAPEQSEDEQQPTPNPDPQTGEIYTELGVPLAVKYPDGSQARCIWDMLLYDGSLILGSGDYDKNRGPAEIWRYDIKEGAFSLSGTVPDEEVNRFSLVYDTLVAPGIDPREDWETGNYYAYENGTWQTHRVLPGGVHCFDIVEFDGLVFAGMGVVEGNSPVVFSIDGGESFDQLPLYKDHEIRDTAGYEYIRVYDFFVFEDELYALLFLFDSEGVRERCYELYRYDYDEDAFFFEDTWMEKITRRSYKNIHIGEKLVFDGALYFTTGYLYTTADMQTLTRIDFPKNAVVCDLYTKGGTLYALTAARDAESGRLKTTVYAINAKETEFHEVFSFLYDVPPMSMVVDGDVFYIGMGNGNAAHEKNGMLLRVSLAEK